MLSTLSNRSVLTSFVLYLILIVVFLITHSSDTDGSRVYQFFSADLSAIFFLKAIFIAPILEEFVFRYLLSNVKSKSLVQVLLLVSITLIFVNRGVLLFVVLAIGGLCFLYILKRSAYSLDFLVLYSSLVFTLLHAGNIDFKFEGTTYFFIVMFFLGVFLSMIRLKFGIGYSILFHAVYNAIIILPSYFLLPNSIQENNEYALVELKKESFMNFSDYGSFSNKKGDTLIVERNLISDIVDSYFQNTENVIYKVQPSLAKYSGKVFFVKKDLESICEIFNLDIDTSKQMAERFIITDLSLKKQNGNHEMGPEFFLSKIGGRGSFNNIILSISKRFNAPVKLDIDDKYKKSIVQVSYSRDAESIDSVFQEIRAQLPFNFSVEKDSVLTTIYTLKN